MNHKTYIIKAALCLPFLLFSSSSLPMFTAFIEKVKKAGQERIERQEKREEEERQRSQERIRERQKKRELVNKLKDIQNIKTIVEVDTAINSIKDEHYEKILTELQRITNQPYYDLKWTINKQRKVAKKLLKQENSHTSHDLSIPHPMTQKLCEAIAQHNINPNNIDLAYSDSSDNCATAYSGSIHTGLFTFDSKFIINKPKITIHKPFLKHSENDQLSIYHHEICHILLQHSHILKQANEKLPNTIIKEDEKNVESYTTSEIYYKKKGISPLASLMEEEADIYASLSNSHIASTQMQQRCSYWPHSHITDKQNHCDQLTVIYNLMKQKEALTISES